MRLFALVYTRTHIHSGFSYIHIYICDMCVCPHMCMYICCICVSVYIRTPKVHVLRIALFGYCCFHVIPVELHRANIMRTVPGKPAEGTAHKPRSGSVAEPGTGHYSWMCWH